MMKVKNSPWKKKKTKLSLGVRNKIQMHVTISINNLVEILASTRKYKLNA